MYQFSRTFVIHKSGGYNYFIVFKLQCELVTAIEINRMNLYHKGICQNPLFRLTPLYTILLLIINPYLLSQVHIDVSGTRIFGVML